MEYHEAAEIARKHPGAILTRDTSGCFIVRLLDGTVISSAAEDSSVMDVLIRESEDHLRELSKVQANFAARQGQLESEIESLRTTCAKLKYECVQLSQQIAALHAEKMTLTTKPSKVSEKEWERIREADRSQQEADRLQQEKEAVQRKAERRLVQCTCSGAVENCARCFGSGEYLVDGYGNQV